MNHDYRTYTYYRSGVALARFRISAKDAFVAPRDESTMEFGAERSFQWPMEPFHEALNLHLPDAVRAVQENAVPHGWEEAAAPASNTARYIQPSGKYPLDFIVAQGRIVACIDDGRHYIGLLVEDGWEHVTPQAEMWRQPISLPEFGKGEARTEMVPMRDGVRLATDIRLPSCPGKKGPWPTILVRTCYGRTNLQLFRDFLHYGYALVFQDVRGRDDSEGKWQPIVNEKDDGDDTLNWIAAQPWSDGNVGMIGPSYLSIVQWQAAASGNPHFKAAVSLVTGGVPMFDFPHRAGVFSPGVMAWTASMRGKTIDAAAMERDDWDTVLKHRPIREIPSVAMGQENPVFAEWMDHEYYDGYWHKANFLSQQHKINVPALCVSGWYDDVCPGTMQVWDMLRRCGREHRKLVSGAWMHNMNSCREIHGNTYGSESVRYDLFPLYLRWFDRFLKNMDNGIDREDRAEYFVIGENRWRSAAEWPPPEAELQELFLSSGGSANTSSGDGVLLSEEPKQGGCDRYICDPADPVPFLIDVSENECLVPENYREVELRTDVLVYTSEPLQEALTVAGEPVAVIYAASDQRDADWVVRITDVDEEGNSVRMCDGIVRARFRRSFIEPKLLIPGEIVRYEIPMTWIANRFAAGHRIRVEVTSGADNSIFPNSNTGLPIADDTQQLAAQHTVHHGGKYCSRIVIPVLPCG